MIDSSVITAGFIANKNSFCENNKQSLTNEMQYEIKGIMTHQNSFLIILMNIE